MCLRVRVRVSVCGGGGGEGCVCAGVGGLGAGELVIILVASLAGQAGSTQHLDIAFVLPSPGLCIAPWLQLWLRYAAFQDTCARLLARRASEAAGAAEKKISILQVGAQGGKADLPVH